MQGNHSRPQSYKQAATGGGASARADHASRQRRDAQPHSYRPASDPRCSLSSVSLSASNSSGPRELSASVPGLPGTGESRPGERSLSLLQASTHPPIQASSTHQAAQANEGASTDLRGAWGEFLGRWSWDLFGNHTFRQDAHPEAAFKLFRVFVSMLNRKLYGPRWHKHGKGIRWVCAMERQRRGVVHFHSLLASPELVELLKSSWRPAPVAGHYENEILELWNDLAGFARIEPIQSAAAVQGYVSKYVVKGGEIELGGPGMPEFKWTGHPARVDGLWLKTAMGRATAQGLYERVTTPAERDALMSWAVGTPGARRATADLRESVRLRIQAARRGSAS